MKKGFSLMELIIVIVIIGVLLSAIVGMSSSKETAKYTVTVNTILSIKKQVDMYMKSKGIIMYSKILSSGGGSDIYTETSKFIGQNEMVNSWGNSYDVTYDKTKNGLMIKTKIPNKNDAGIAIGCDAVKNSLIRIIPDTSCNDVEITVVFPE